MENEKYVSLARKLNELAKRGVGGEKENAQAKLESVMKRYNITIEDIEGNERFDFDFELKKDIPIKFIRQVLCSIVGNISKYGCQIYQYKYVRKRKHICRKITSIEPQHFSEFIAKVSVLWEHYQKESARFYSAFIQANHIYEKVDPDLEDELNYEKNEKSLEESMRLASLIGGIEKKNFNKQIE